LKLISTAWDLSKESGEMRKVVRFDDFGALFILKKRKKNTHSELDSTLLPSAL